MKITISLFIFLASIGCTKETTIMNCTPIVRHHLTIGGAFFMTKYSLELKLKAVLAYLEGMDSF
ncbi:hypothetical protein, partial [Peribacillus frigoritolerans]|uniref:hypothetical protein n=1 Tax=Peribacillus frigoritolerans TaxID=450367 RepID=UPI00203BC532